MQCWPRCWVTDAGNIGGHRAPCLNLRTTAIAAGERPRLRGKIGLPVPLLRVPRKYDRIVRLRGFRVAWGAGRCLRQSQDGSFGIVPNIETRFAFQQREESLTAPENVHQLWVS